MPSTTNLAIPYPSATDLVSLGYDQIADVATGIDAFFGAWTAYTPTGTNITGGTYDAAYKKIGKIGFLRINITAGTATAAGTIAVSLPSGWSSVANGGFAAQNGTVGLCNAFLNGTANTITIYNGTATANWALGASVTNTRIMITMELD